MTQDYKPDFRALCAELADAFEQHVEDVIDAGCGWMELKTEKLLACARRRPKPPSLKEQALEGLTRIESTNDFFSNQMKDLATIRRALEQLDD